MKRLLRIWAISLYQNFGINRLRAVFNTRDFRKSTEEAVNKYLSEEEKADNGLVASIKRDIRRSYAKFLVNPNEYFLFGFRNLNDREKGEFLPDALRNQLLRNKFGWKPFEELSDKYSFYLRNKDYFKREAIVVKAGIAFDAFVKKYQSVFVKPLSGSCGTGAFVLNYSNIGEVRNTYAKLMGGVII